MMKHERGIRVVLLFMLALITSAFIPTICQAKAGQITIDLNQDGRVWYMAPTSLNGYSKVKVSISNKKIAKASYIRHKELGKTIKFTAVSHGKTKCKIVLYKKGKKVKTYRYDVKVIGKGKDGYKSMCKKAFQIQNSYRRANGASNLKWSDTLYDFAMYRLKHSGFDMHVNLDSDAEKHFGNVIGLHHISFGENMATGQTTAKAVMLSWKHSDGHYRNLQMKAYKYGAIARYKDDWCAIFLPEDISVLKDWKSVSKETKAITIKRYDSASSKYVKGSSILYYESDDKWNTTVSKSIIKEDGLVLYLKIGKTYTFTERKTPNGMEKAENVTITVTEDGLDEVILGK